MQCGNKKFSLDGSSSAHLTGTRRQKWCLVHCSCVLSLALHLCLGASALAWLSVAQSQKAQVCVCVCVMGGEGLTQMAVVVMLEGRRCSQLADGGQVIHRSHPTFSNARGESSIGSASMTMWVQKQRIAADQNHDSKSLEIFQTQLIMHNIVYTLHHHLFTNTAAVSLCLLKI